MRVFVAGATGVIGRPLVARLLAGGHQVTGMTRTPGKAGALRAAGAEPVVADALDAQAVELAVRAARPDVVVHQLTAIPAAINPRTMARDFELTDRLRSEGTPILVGAALAAGARRVVAQSIAFAYAPGAAGGAGETLHVEDDPLWLDAPEPFRRSVRAIATLEGSVLDTDGIDGAVLRYGYLYGPGTAIARGGSSVEMVRRRRFPIGGDGRGTWPFVHVDDAVQATVIAIECAETGVFNVVDDEPARVSEWVPELAQVLGARPPRRLPLWLVRLAAGPYGVQLFTAQQSASNRRARERLGWSPRHASWRQGFREGLG